MAAILSRPQCVKTTITLILIHFQKMCKFYADKNLTITNRMEAIFVWLLLTPVLCTTVLYTTFKTINVPTLSMHCYPASSRGQLETSAMCANSTSCLATIQHENRSTALCVDCNPHSVTSISMNSMVSMRFEGQAVQLPGSVYINQSN